MSHTHTHAHGSTYYLDQLCTIFACGALGGVAIMMYADGRLGFILTPFFFAPVLVGGIALAAMAVVRAITLWREAGALNRVAHDHDHDHVDAHIHDHEHDHDHCHDPGHDQECGHDHEHGWTPIRYVVLLLPVTLFFLNLPNSSFSAATIGRMLSADKTESTTVMDKHVRAVNLGFQELASAAHSPVTRDALQGQTGELSGKYSPIDSHEFTLVRMKMTCCVADAIPVPVRIVSDEPLSQFRPGDPVEVEGRIEFHKVVGRDKYIPVLHVLSADKVRRVASVPDYGLN